MARAPSTMLGRLRRGADATVHQRRPPGSSELAHVSDMLDLRRTAARNLLAKGVHETVAMKITGMRRGPCSTATRSSAATTSRSQEGHEDDDGRPLDRERGEQSYGGGARPRNLLTLLARPRESNPRPSPWKCVLDFAPGCDQELPSALFCGLVAGPVETEYPECPLMCSRTGTSTGTARRRRPGSVTPLHLPRGASP